MPPKTMKKIAGPGNKRLIKTTKPKISPKVSEESVKKEEKPVDVKIIEEKAEIKVEEKAVENGSVLVTENDVVKEVKETVEEFEKDEQLDLEDNEPDSEPEEYGAGAVDYGEKEAEHDDVQEEEYEGEEEGGDVDEGEEGNMVEEEPMEDDAEEHDVDEGEEDEAHPEEHPEEHAEMVAEEQEQHDVYKERRKRKEFEVFVGGLDKDATEEDLRKVFKEVGEVMEVRLMMNPQTKKNKGFAFLRFETVEQAKRACTDLKHPVVNGKKCGVAPSQDSDTLFLGNICKTWTEKALRSKLKQYGVETIDDLTLVEDGNNEGMNRGFAFLEFSSRSDAMDAFRRLQKRDVLFGVAKPAKVSFADSFVDPGDEIMAQVKTVFVDGLLSAWDEDRVRDLLKGHGAIEKIELARNMPSAKRNDFGFITFDTHDAAVTCAKSINNAELGEGENKAKVRARLSRPIQRGRGKHDFRSERVPSRGSRGAWGRPVPHSLPLRGSRGFGGRLPPVDRGMRRPVSFRGRRPITSMPPPRARPLPPISRSYDRRPQVPAYPKSSSKRDYSSSRREELPPRSRAAAEYGSSRVPPERRPSYRDDYSSRGSGYADLPRSAPRAIARRPYVDEGYEQRFERPPPSYREGRSRDYDSISGSKRPYTALDDVSPRYAETGTRPSRARLDYELGGSSASQYGDGYSDRMGRSSIGYGSGRSSLSGQEGLYSSSRQGMSYGGGGSYGSSDVGGGGYSSSFGSDYMSRGGDVGGSSSYSSLYSSRDLGGSSYLGGSSGSGSYY